MWFDGAGNFKGVGIAVVLVLESGQNYPASTKIRFLCIKNMAEYEACILGIKMTVNMNINELLVIGVSDLLIHQVQGEWSTKNVKIFPYLHCVKTLCKFTKIDFKHIPMIQNDFDDVLATTSSMIQHQNKNYIDPIEVEITDQYDYYFYIDEELDGKLWYHDVNGFLEIREYLENANNSQKKARKRLENHFFLNREVLLQEDSRLGFVEICRCHRGNQIIGRNT
ncbi:uncharacterized protein LOC107797137 [Nicotiana tabacum]|uniref:Uncharacterized protein LOC107797137 n=1 Tax=Nicotiana tabacum TaxID=4097 RepID=A0A1S4AGD8_TOBAC|nr:PREDICTED: uncharacterized protein LOC107797137 [Nicotiana tabacum]